MRERTTWNRTDIQKQAASSRRAEDPRAMNQDHLSQQPKADAYITGDPSTFAEDIHPNDWSVEYSGGQTSRNEIGMPEMRKDTFNHPEKTAALDEETLVKKADLCCKVARQILGSRAVEAAVEDQALALMNLSDSDLIATVNRMAQDQDQDQGQGQKQAQDQDQDQAKSEDQAKAKQAQDQQGQDQDQSKQAKDLPPEFLEQIQKKKDEAKDKDDKKEAGRKVGQLEQMAQQIQMLSQQIQQMMQSQQQGQGQGQQVMEQAPQQQVEQSNDQMIDQMLSQQQAPMQDQANDFGIQMDSPQMDIGEVGMGPEDDVLTTLFANNTEVQNAQQAHTLQHGTPASMQFQASGPMARTASTRTVGTRPTGGVASIGGLGSSQSGGDVEKLSNLWNSAPDVSDVFRS